MIWIIIAIVVIVIIVHNNKKKKAQQSGGQSAAAPRGRNPAMQQALDMVTAHPFTRQVVGFYSGLWRPEGKLYQAAQKGEPPIAAFTVHVLQEGAYETVYLRDGTHFDRQVTPFTSMGANPFTLNTPEQRSVLEQLLANALSQLPTLKEQNGRLAVVNGVKPEAGKPASKASATASAKSGGAKDSAPPKAGDPIDQDAFARAFAHMSVGDGAGTAAPKAESPKAESPKPQPEPQREQAAPAGQAGLDKELVTNVLGYYHELWNRENGSLYTELDKMPVRNFTVQVRADRLVESVWLEGDELPLVNETMFSKLSPDTPNAYPLSGQTASDQLYALIRDYLLRLGTVELRRDSFYPLRPGQAPAGGGPSPAGSAPSGGKGQDSGQADKEARLRAQVQALLEQQKRDNPPKK